MPNLLPTALLMDEIETLGEVLDEHSPFDLDGVRGLCHAVAVAPSLLPTSAWVRTVFPEGLEELEQEHVDACIQLLMRQHQEVIHALARGFTLTPEPDDIEGCEAFARGYLAGAQLDPAWTGVGDRWTFAAPFAYLVDLRELIPPRDLEELERDFQPDPKASIRQHMGRVITGTQKTFVIVRRAHAAQHQHATAPAATRVGRNDPCPCGSGKKYKRCCAIRNDAMN